MAWLSTAKTVGGSWAGGVFVAVACVVHSLAGLRLSSFDLPWMFLGYGLPGP